MTRDPTNALGPERGDLKRLDHLAISLRQCGRHSCACHLSIQPTAKVPAHFLDPFSKPAPALHAPPPYGPALSALRLPARNESRPWVARVPHRAFVGHRSIAPAVHITHAQRRAFRCDRGPPLYRRSVPTRALPAVSAVSTPPWPRDATIVELPRAGQRVRTRARRTRILELVTASPGDRPPSCAGTQSLPRTPPPPSDGLPPVGTSAPAPGEPCGRAQAQRLRLPPN